MKNHKEFMLCDSEGILTNEALEARGFINPYLFDKREREFIKVWDVTADTSAVDIMESMLSPYSIDDSLHGNEEAGMDDSGELIYDAFSSIPNRLIQPEDFEPYGLEDTAREYKYDFGSEPCWWEEVQGDNHVFLKNSEFQSKDMFAAMVTALLAGSDNYIALHSTPDESSLTPLDVRVKRMYSWELSSYVDKIIRGNLRNRYNEEDLQTIRKRIESEMSKGAYEEEFLEVVALSAILRNGLYDKPMEQVLCGLKQVKKEIKKGEFQLLLGSALGLAGRREEAYAHLALAEKLGSKEASLLMVLLQKKEDQLPRLEAFSFARCWEFYKKEKKASRKKSNRQSSSGSMLSHVHIRHLP